jgi:CBS domain-containing protein
MSKTVADLMSTNVVTLDADEDLVLAEDLMRLEHIRHLPVVRGGRLLGLVTHRDLLKAQARLLAQLGASVDDRVVNVRAADLMNDSPATVRPDTDAAEAARILLNEKYGCLPVVDGQTLVGIITDSDFLRFAVDSLTT